jgi:hypothetical protein
MKGERHRLSPLSLYSNSFSFGRCVVCQSLIYGFWLPLSDKKIFRNQPTRNNNCLWQPCLLTDRDEINILYKNCLWQPCLLTNRGDMSNLYRGPSKDASYQVSAPMEGSVLSFLKAQWKVSYTDSAHWACIVILFLLAVVLYVNHWFTDSDYPFVIFKLFWLSLCYLQTLLITPLLSSNGWLPLLLTSNSSDFPFVNFKLFWLPL